MKTFLRENTWLKDYGRIFSHGWGNGYVLIPKDNPLHGKHYYDINVNVHGGLTFSELVDEDMIEIWGLDPEDLGSWCVGFDTAHLADNPLTWTKESVMKETEFLRDSLINYNI